MGGVAGVDIFFIISGFVMMISSQPKMGKPSSGIEFMKRRIERIVPLFWIYTTLKIVLNLAIPGVGMRSLGRVWQVISSYLFLPAVPVLAVGWTLNFEMFFYLLFAMALALEIRPVRLIAPLFCLILLIPANVFARMGLLDWSNPIILEFLFGMSLYVAYRKGWLRLPQTWTLLMATLGFVAILAFGGEGRSIPRPVLLGLPALAIVSSGVGLESRLGDKVPGWLVENGDASYSTYLSHTFVLHFAGVVLGYLRASGGAFVQLISVTAMVIASILVGILSYRFLEKPMIDYFRNRRRVAVSVAG
jgi:exopolysaccharide production protein ExoZ